MDTRLSLLALALGAFGIGLTEFAPMGMLPSIAADLGVGLPSAGLLISAYAVGVIAGAPLVLLFDGRLSRRSLLMLSMGLYTLGNILAALSEGYEHLMLARVMTALNQAPFFGVGAVVAAGLVPKERQAAAVAAMFSGLAVANIGGVPLAVWLDATVGWRLSFWAMAMIGLATIAALWLALPRETGVHVVPRVRDEIRVFQRSGVLIALAATVIFSITLFSVFTYITPILHEGGATAREVSLVLVLFGVSLTVGNWLGGHFADRSADRTLVVTFLVIALALCGLAASIGSLAIMTATIVVWGTATFASTSPLQLRVMTAAADAPNLASTVNIAAFNLGNALGAAAASAVVGFGLGLPALCLVGAGFAVIGMVLILLVSGGLRSRTGRPGPKAAGGRIEQQ
jgi:DHA1 family inner membrane transport protein